MTTPGTFVIVGAGLAGVKAAETLRAEGHTGPVILIGAEPHRPYERPPLSKDYLLGKSEAEDAFVHPGEWFGDHSIDLRMDTRVVVLERSSRQVVLDDGSQVGYDRLLLATGSTPRRLPVPGADLPGVHYLRTLDDAQALHGALERARRLLVIGGGWIGLEVAAAARTNGLEVTVVEQAELPLLGVLGQEVAGVFADLHRAHGVDLRCGVGVSRLLDEDGRLAGVELADGSRIDADVALVGIGVSPDVDLARDSGLAMGKSGILVNECLCTSDGNVFAAGDVAEASHPLLGRHIRVEHWANALNQGPHAARSMLCDAQAYERLPYFYTDQYDLGMEYTGYAGPGDYDRVVLRGNPEGLRFMAFWLKDGRVIAGMHVNEWDSIEAIGEVIRAGRSVDADRLANPDVPVQNL